MGHQYAGADSFPVDFTIPDDLDDIDAASVDVAFEALGDRSKYLRGAFDSFPGLNWRTSVSVGAACRPLAWSDLDQAWYACQTTASSSTIYRSLDGGRSWATHTLPGGITQLAIAADTSGNVVILYAGHVERGARSAYDTFTWSAVTATPFSAIGSGSLVYEPVNGRWVGVAATSSAIVAGSSPDALTWTAATPPAYWSGLATSPLVSLGVGNGLVVAAIEDTTSTVRTMVSTDGGQTWGSDTSVAVTGPTLTVGTAPAGPVWSAVDSLWYLAVANTSGTRKTQVFSSPDGATWTSTASLVSNDVRIIALGVTGRALVGLCDDGRVVASLDKGVTFYRVASSGLSSPTNMVAGGGGLLALDATSNAVASQRIGPPTETV